MAQLALAYDSRTIELQTIRWQEDLSGAQRAAIAGSLEKKRGVPEYAYVDPRSLFVDETYQRPLSMDRVWEIATDFNWFLFDPLWLGRRTDDRLYVVDGRHRLAAALIIGYDKVGDVPAQIRRTTGVEEEAKIFVDLQEKRREITTAQRFAAKLIFKDSTAVNLQRLLSKHGFKVPTESWGNSSTVSKQNEITAIGTLEQIYKQGGSERVSDLLQILRLAWDGFPPSTRSDMMRALNNLLARSSLAPSTIARRLQVKDEWSLIERGQRHGHSKGIPASEALTDVLEEIVNNA